MIFYTSQELSGILKVNEKTIRNLIKSGQIPAAKIGRQWRVSEYNLNEFFNKRSTRIRKAV